MTDEVALTSMAQPAPASLGGKEAWGDPDASGKSKDKKKDKNKDKGKDKGKDKAKGKSKDQPAGKAKKAKKDKGRGPQLHVQYPIMILNNADRIFVVNIITGEMLARLEGHSSDVNCLYTVNGILYSGSKDGDIRVWNIKGARMVRVLEGHDGTINSFLTDENNTVLYSGSKDGTVCAWNMTDPTNAKLKRVFRTPPGHAVTSICICAENLLAGTREGVIFGWNKYSSSELPLFHGAYHTGAVEVLIRMPDHSRFFSGGPDGEIGAWRSDSGGIARLGNLAGHADNIEELKIYGNLLYSASADGTVRSFSLEEREFGAAVRLFEGHTAKVTCFAVNKGYLFTGSDDATVRAFNVNTGACERVFKRHKEGVSSIVAIGDYVFSSARDKLTITWDAFDFIRDNPRNAINLAKFEAQVKRDKDPEAAREADAEGDEGDGDEKMPPGEITPFLMREVRCRGGGVRGIALSETTVFTGSSTSIIKGHSVATGHLTHVFKGHEAGIRALHYEDGKLFSASKDATARVWDVNSKLCLATLRGHTGGLTCMRVMYGSIFTAGSDGTVHEWEIKSLTLRRVYLKHLAGQISIMSIELDATTTTMFLGLEDNTIQAFDMMSERHLATFNCHIHPQEIGELLDNGVLCMQLVPGATSNDTLLLSGGADGYVCATKVATGELLYRYVGSGGAIRCLRVAGGYVFTGSDDTMVRYYALHSKEFIIQEYGHALDSHTSGVRSLAIGHKNIYAGSTQLIATKLGHFTNLGVATNTVYGETTPAPLRTLNTYKNVVEFAIMSILLLVEFFQLVAFAFTAKTQWAKEQQQTPVTTNVSKFQSLGLPDTGYLGQWIAAMMVVALFVATFILKETLHWRIFLSPNKPKLRYMWLLLVTWAKLCAGPFFFPVLRVLISSLACVTGAKGLSVMSLDPNVSCGTPNHVVFVVTSLLALIFFVPLCFRLLRVGGDMNNMVLTVNPFAWGADTVFVVRSHPLSAGPKQTYNAMVMVVTKVVLMIVSIYAVNDTAYVLPALGLVILAASFVFPPYDSMWANYARSGLNLGIMWTYTISAVAKRIGTTFYAINILLYLILPVIVVGVLVAPVVYKLTVTPPPLPSVKRKIKVQNKGGPKPSDKPGSATEEDETTQTEAI